ncbi:hypothetical protein G7Z99_09695 [Pseudomonas entomophila]|uniref:hypothetical protein n=1 Tax=Pseudomonas entomophila TaxID=312306 RepID=UPI0015E27FBF|nr:hypothetical protein [Pseudomonas entomophila]MBA1189322.1 hypothetical protein [Pseudomonas entomophila]
MILIVTEAELDGIDFTSHQKVALARSADDPIHATAFSWPQPAWDSVKFPESKVLVLVEDPFDLTTEKRVRAKVLAILGWNS